MNKSLSKNFAPICLFTYNRLFETKETVEALRNNYLARNSELYIFSDGHVDEIDNIKVKEIRKYLNTISGFKAVKIFKSTYNKGLAESIISGVTATLQKFEKIIVVEDDLVTTPNFLNFMNQALDYYYPIKKIQSVSGYSFKMKHFKSNCDIYFQKRPFSWGWATWHDRWSEEFFNKEDLSATLRNDKLTLKTLKKIMGNDSAKMLLNSLNGKNDSWYARWIFNHFQNNTYTVYPIFSLVENIGHGEYSTHCKGINSYEYVLDKGSKKSFSFCNLYTPVKDSYNPFLKYFTTGHKLKYRMKLIRSRYGRKQLIVEIKMRFKRIISELL